MRIALLTHQWPGIRMGGIGAAVRQTAAALASIGHEVHLFTLAIPDDLTTSIPKGIHFHPVYDLATRIAQSQSSPHLAAAIDSAGEGAYRLAIATLLCDALRHIHQQAPFDIIEAPEVDALSLPLLLSDLNVPIVTHLHCCTALAHLGNKLPPSQFHSLTTALEFAAIHLADSLCAPTRAVVTATQRFIPISDNVTILPHPYQCSTNDFIAPPDDGPMLFIGRIERLKGVETIARALNAVLPLHPKATFRFIGPDTPTGPGGASMRQHAQSLLSPEIASRVTFTGELTRQQVANELSRCRFAVQPSLWENFSMTCCEAFAAGRTVIAGAGTGSQELIGDAGLAIDPHSPAELAAAINSLWTDRVRLNALSEAAFDRIRTEFAPHRIAQRRAAFYTQTIEQFKQTRPSQRTERLSTLPPSATIPLLPALCNLTSFLTGVATSSLSPGARLLQIMERLRTDTGHPAKVLLYGAGKFTTRLLAQRALWEAKGHQVAGLIDDHPRFQNESRLFDLPVISTDRAIRLAAAGESLPPIILSTDTYQDQFWQQTQPLRDHQVQVFRLMP